MRYSETHNRLHVIFSVGHEASVAVAMRITELDSYERRIKQITEKVVIWREAREKVESQGIMIAASLFTRAKLRISQRQLRSQKFLDLNGYRLSPPNSRLVVKGPLV